MLKPSSSWQLKRLCCKRNKGGRKLTLAEARKQLSKITVENAFQVVDSIVEKLHSG